MEVAIAGAAGAVLVKVIDWLIDRARRRTEERQAERVASGSVETSDARLLFEVQEKIRHDLMEALDGERDERREETAGLRAAHAECEARYSSLRSELSKVQRALREAGEGA